MKVGADQTADRSAIAVPFVIPPVAPHRDMVRVMLLAIFDAFALYEALLLAYGVRATDPAPFRQSMTVGHFEILAACISPLWVLIFSISGLYAMRHRPGHVSEVGRIVASVACGVMALVCLDYMSTTTPIFPGRSVPVYALAFGIAFVIACRQFVRLCLWAAYHAGIGLRNVVVLGTGTLAQHITTDLRRPRNGYRVLAAVDANAHNDLFRGDIRIYLDLESALGMIESRVDEIMQADDELDRAEVARLMSFANAQGIAYRFVPDQYGVYAAASSMTTISGIPVMEVRLTALDGWGAVVKRIFDIAMSLMLLVMLSPVLVVISAIVKFNDPAGPVLYRHSRLGRGGKPIKILKFRTMQWKYSTGPDRPYKNAADAFEAMGRHDLCREFRRDHKVRDDPRVSRIGRWLRRSSLDELPQLFNSLRGELSVIGPRPVTAAELERYGDQQRSFLALKPGITGLWQISGRNDLSYDDRVKLDVFYIEHWSVRLDMSILLRTAGAVLAKRGAY